MLWGIYSAIYGEVNVSVEKCVEIKGDYVEKWQICFISLTLKSWSGRKLLDPTTYVCSAQYGCFRSSLVSCFPGMLLRYCLSDFEVVPVAPFIYGITFAFTFHMYWISVTRSLYFNIFPVSFLITLMSPGIATSINMHVPFLLSRNKISDYYYYYYYYSYYNV